MTSGSIEHVVGWCLHICVYLAVLYVISQGMDHRSRSSFCSKQVEVVQRLQGCLENKYQSCEHHEKQEYPNMLISSNINWLTNNLVNISLDILQLSNKFD